MYVCLCNGFTDKQIRGAAEGCGSVPEVYRSLGGALRCGKCVPVAASLCRMDDAARPRPSGDGD